MKITLRNKKPLIDIDSFNKKADVIFKDVVIPQIKKYKTMKAKEKAQELFCKMYGCDNNTDLNDIYLINADGYFIAKESVLIAVDEIIRANPHSNPFNTDVHSTMKYWLDVKQEIQKL